MGTVPTHGDAASSRVTPRLRRGRMPRLLDKVPAVVEVGVHRLGRSLLHAAAEVVVAVGDENVNIFDWPHMRAFTEINLAGFPRGRRQVR